MRQKEIRQKKRKQVLQKEDIYQFQKKLEEEEKAVLTMKKYLHDILMFYEYLPIDKKVTKERVLAYKQYLKEHYQISSANSMLAAFNLFLSYQGWNTCKVKQFKVQRVFFCRQDKFLSKDEYERIVNCAKRKGKEQLSLIMQTICSTGIRVSELCYIDVQAVRRGKALIHNKGKSRVVFLPKELLWLLREYCKSHQIHNGPIFLSKRGKPMDRSVIWRQMKSLCKEAKVEESKVFPHNLRHLFALTFYKVKKDLLRLAEILGHTSIETTRIYTLTTEGEQQQLLSQLGLVLKNKKIT